MENVPRGKRKARGGADLVWAASARMETPEQSRKYAFMKGIVTFQRIIPLGETVRDPDSAYLTSPTRCAGDEQHDRIHHLVNTYATVSRNRG